MKSDQSQAQEMIVRLFRAASIDYADSYIKMYSAFNCWYRFITNETLNSRALQELKRRTYIWLDYLDGETLGLLRSPMRRLYILTQHRPMKTAAGGVFCLLSEEDWCGLIDFWYIVRCDIVHANDTINKGYYPLYIRLAYDTLSLYMNEIVRRIRTIQKAVDEDRVSGGFLVHIAPQLHQIDQISARRFHRMISIGRTNEMS